MYSQIILVAITLTQRYPVGAGQMAVCVHIEPPLWDIYMGPNGDGSNTSDWLNMHTYITSIYTHQVIATR